MQIRPWKIVLVATVATTIVVGSAGPALAHKERQIESPVRGGSVPDLARKHRETLVVSEASSRPSRERLAAIRASLRAGGEERERAKTALATRKQNTKLFRKCRYEHIRTA